jgi:hypothetical protein
MKKTLVIWFAALGCIATTATAQVPDFTPRTRLKAPLVHNDLAEARRLLELGADPNEGRFVGFAPVFLAIQRNDLALVR